MRSTILILLSAATLCAETVNPAVIESLVDQLGAGEFKVRTAAEKSLAELAEQDPETMREALKERLESEEDPEIRNRIGRVLRLVSRMLPETLEFSRETLDAKKWEQMGDEERRVDFELEDGVLEFDSTGDAGNSAFFVHRFAVEAAKGELFGPGPVEVSQRITLDAEIKVIKQKMIRRGGAGVHLNIEDHRSSFGVMILEDGVFFYRSREIHKMDTTDDWHHYRMVIEGDVQSIYVDDLEEPVLEMARPRNAGRRWATFGDGTSTGGAHAQIRNVVVSRSGE